MISQTSHIAWRVIGLLTVAAGYGPALWASPPRALGQCQIGLGRIVLHLSESERMDTLTRLRGRHIEVQRVGHAETESGWVIGPDPRHPGTVLLSRTPLGTGGIHARIDAFPVRVREVGRIRELPAEDLSSPAAPLIPRSAEPEIATPPRPPRAPPPPARPIPSVNELAPLSRTERIARLFSPEAWGLSHTASSAGRPGRIPEPGGTESRWYFELRERELALRNGWILENPDLRTVRPGTYTYVVTADGITLGHVVDGWEFGVKHFHLANGRAVLSAGEVQFTANGTVLLNQVSGTYSAEFARVSPERAAQGTERAARLFGAELGEHRIRALPTETDILPTDAPFDRSRMEIICRGATANARGLLAAYRLCP